jgi:hypothetical protein
LKHLRIAALLGVLLTQSGCLELLLVAMDVGVAAGLTHAAMESQEKRKLEAESVVADAKILEK